MKKARLHQEWEFWKDGQKRNRRMIELPHDAMLEEKRDPQLENGSGSGYFPGGTYWYEKRIFGRKAYENWAVILEFEGIYMDSTVYLNGEEVGGWIYGYTNFFVDLTGKLRIGEDNVLLVKVDNSKTPNSRWYTGSGIYRPVNLWIGGACYIAPQGLRVKTLSTEPAVIEASSELLMVSGMDRESVTVEYTIYEEGKAIVSAVGDSVRMTIPKAKLWSAETPYLYQIKAAVKRRGEIVDEAVADFGIRTLAWSAQKGFQVNGRTVKLRGGCVHHDHGILGACAYEKAELRRVKKLKEFGFNTLRYSHYPAGKSFLEACDRLGMYVLDESFDQWRIPNTAYDYSLCFDQEWEKDLKALAAKDYNHPCVIMYCIGNEISDTGRSYGAGLARQLSDTLRREDDTRPITLATNIYLSLMASMVEQKEIESGKAVGSIEVNELMAEIPAMKASLTIEKIEDMVGKSYGPVDIAGYNYGRDLYQKTHELIPERIILSSETVPSKMAENWRVVEENHHIIGDFLWTAWDYLGEAGVGLPVYGATETPFAKPYPCLTAACGSFDLIGFPEAAAYYEAVIWGVYRKPYIAVRPVDHSGEAYTLGGWRLTDALDCWTWEGCEGQTAQIFVYSIGRTVELTQDGVSLGKKELEEHKAEFGTVYWKGTLEAVSYDEAGAEIGRTALRTAGDSACLRIQPEEAEVKADSEELVYVPVCVTDAEGVLRVNDDRRITVAVEGEGRLLALGSGRPETEELFDGPSHTSWHGRVLAVIRCSGRPGTIRVTAMASGCEAVSAEIQAV